MSKKPTIKSRYEEIREILEELGKDELVDFVDGRIAQLVKNSAIERKPTARQVENEVYKDDILAFMANGNKFTANDILENVPSIIASGMSINRVSALLTQLTTANIINRVTENRKNYYSAKGEF